MSYKPVERTAGWGCARDQRLFQILTILDEAANAPQGSGWVTSGKIAKATHITTSPHFRGLLDELLRWGVVAVREKPWRRNMVAYEWCIQENAYHHRKFAGMWKAYLTPEEALQ